MTKRSSRLPPRWTKQSLRPCRRCLRRECLKRDANICLPRYRPQAFTVSKHCRAVALKGKDSKDIGIGKTSDNPAEIVHSANICLSSRGFRGLIDGSELSAGQHESVCNK